MLALAASLSMLIVFILVVFALMLGELAPWLIFASLSAAPPHFTSVHSSVSSATPVEVLFIVIFQSTQLTHFYALIHFTLATLQLDDSLLHFLTFGL